LRIARSRAYELVGSGEIPSVRIGCSVRISRTELERWLEEQRHPKRHPWHRAQRHIAQLYSIV
jgi:excisionase family DNA binding protein